MKYREARFCAQWRARHVQMRIWPRSLMRIAAFLLLALALPVFAQQQGPLERQRLDRTFQQERLELERQQSNKPAPSTPAGRRSQQRLDESQQLQQRLLQERQRREALTFEQLTRDLSEPQQRQQWQIEQQQLQRERDMQLQRFRQERPR